MKFNHPSRRLGYSEAESQQGPAQPRHYHAAPDARPATSMPGFRYAPSQPTAGCQAPATVFQKTKFAEGDNDKLARAESNTMAIEAQL